MILRHRPLPTLVLPGGSRPERRALGALVAVTVAAGLMLTACGTGEQSGGAAQAAPVVATTPDTIALSSVPLGAVPTTSPASTAPTMSPASTEPTTTEAPATTEPAPTTTTEPPLPANVVPVPKLIEPLRGVGTSNGPDTARVQQRLIDLGFWVSGADGSYGLTTRQAVMAFQKYWGLPATGRVDDWTAAVMSEMDQRARGAAEGGDLVEVDKSRQLLFIVKGGLTVWVLNASTGTEIPYTTVNKNDPTKIETGSSITPAGTYKVERQRAEGWWDGDLGSIYRPKYFVGGVAVHGSNSIPNYPASHGCVRVSVPAMDMIWATDLVPLKTTVWVHGEIPRA
jgi:peptidoglycan hydrolase-like protein with peptidoglycan-binding domain